MAIDEYLLEQQILGAVPTLRFYGFNPPTVTIGLSQAMSDDVIARIKARGFDVVRRPTGGRAVLHYKDLTYSFLACETGKGDYGILAQSVSAAYKQICKGLQLGLNELGINAELGSSETAYRHLADCFLASTNADLQIGGKKLAGSAQLRRRGAVLQHGSIPLNLDQGLMLELLEGRTETTETDQNAEIRHANLYDALGRAPALEELTKSFKKGFADAFKVQLFEIPLTEAELSAVRKPTE